MINLEMKRKNGSRTDWGTGCHFLLILQTKIAS